MKITLCGSAKFEKQFKDLNKRMTLAGHVVYSLAVYPSDEGGKDWYSPDQKAMLDNVHKQKIENSDAIFVISPGGYIGESTKSEIEHARVLGKKIYSHYPHSGMIRTCFYPGCSDPLRKQPCALCYE